MHDIHSKARPLPLDPKSLELWARFRQGDREAFGSIYRQHIDGLFHYGMHFCRDEERVKDCLQDLFRDMWAERQHISSEVRNIKYYLLSSLRRRLLRSLQNDRRYPVRFPGTTFDFELIPPRETVIILDELYQERVAQLHQAIALLSRRQREVIYLRFFQNLSYGDVAELMSMQVDSVYNLVSKAIGLLKKTFLLTLLFLPMISFLVKK
jgi:RNA polymerase sigma factor (sigma-70 family)